MIDVFINNLSLHTFLICSALHFRTVPTLKLEVGYYAIKRIIY